MRLILAAAACVFMLAAAPISVQFENGVFVVQGWAPADAPAGGWASLLSVYTGDDPGIPPMLGEYAVRDGKLTFRPKYPPSPGIQMRAVFRDAEFRFEIPRQQVTARTQVARIYPGSAELPENQLKFYLEFSAPMSRGHAWKHIHLLRADGSAVELPFLEIDQEMWDADAKRLTILFDPGRIKRGVKPLVDIGPAIEAGHSYTLVIDREWPDASGAPLVTAHRKEFRVTAADREPIDPSKWAIAKVSSGTRDPLIIAFSEPLDAALALRLIQLQGVAGSASLGPEEREWRFVPDSPWQPGQYSIQVDSALEDLAGNKVGRAFDVDTFDRVSRRVTRDTVSLPFRIER